MQSYSPHGSKRKACGSCSCSTCVMCTCIIILLCVIIGLVLVFLFTSAVATIIDMANTCSDKSCVETANELLQSIDTSVDPCVDFYKYTCGNWDKHHPMPPDYVSYSVGDSIHRKTIHRLIDALQQNDTKGSDSRLVQQAKQLYRGCLDQDRIEQLGLQPVSDVLNSLGLEVDPLTAGSSSVSLSLLLARVKRELGMDVLFRAEAQRHPKTSSKKVLTVGMIRQTSPLPNALIGKQKLLKRASMAMKNSEAEDDYYVKYVTDILVHVHMWANNLLDIDDSTRQTFKEMAVNIMEFDVLINEIGAETAKVVMNPVELPIYGLQRRTDTLNGKPWLVDWKAYFRELYSGISVISLDLEGSEMIVLDDPQYLTKLVQKTNATLASALKTYVWWSVVENIVPHLDKETRELYLVNHQKKYPSFSPPPRTYFCASSVFGTMEHAVVAMLADPKFHNTTGQQVQNMMSSVVDAFVAHVRKLGWMDGESRRKAMSKARSVRTLIGYKPETLDKKWQDNLASQLDIDQGWYVRSMLRINQHSTLESLKTLRSSANEIEWVAVPYEVNAYHIYDYNAINIPVGFIQVPTYHPKLNFLKYGAVGNVLAHELMHGFDTYGYRYDKNGNFQQWMSNTTIQKYLNRTQCFVDQYNGMNKDSGNSEIGQLTLTENIADNGGLREAFRAFKHVSNKDDDKQWTLHGLHSYTNNQMFFISFAHMWCEYSIETSEHASFDLHSPTKQRVIGTLQNMREFAEAWDCKLNDPMVRGFKSCVLW